MRLAIVNADDFGLCVETNLAVQVAFEQGILTSASLMPNMPWFDHAVETVIPRLPQLGLGIHFVLTSGRSVANPQDVPLLVDGQGLFKHSFLGLLRLLSGRDRLEARRQIEQELTAQLGKLRATGIAIDHVNSHQHVHMIPAIWRIMASVTSRSGCSLVRLGRSVSAGARPAWSRSSSGLRGSLTKRLVLAACARPTRQLAPERATGLVVRHPDHLAVAMTRAGMDRQALVDVLSRLPEGVTEIVTHPSLASVSTVATLAGSVSRDDLGFLSSPGRKLELRALTDPEVRSVVGQHGIALTSFGMLPRRPPPAVGARL